MAMSAADIQRGNSFCWRCCLQVGGDVPDPASSSAPFRIFNFGNNTLVNLLDYACAIEASLGRGAMAELLPLQPGGVPRTYADVSGLQRHIGERGIE